MNVASCVLAEEDVTHHKLDCLVAVVPVAGTAMMWGEGAGGLVTYALACAAGAWLLQRLVCIADNDGCSALVLLGLALDLASGLSSRTRTLALGWVALYRRGNVLSIC